MTIINKSDWSNGFILYVVVYTDYVWSVWWSIYIDCLTVYTDSCRQGTQRRLPPEDHETNPVATPEAPKQQTYGVLSFNNYEGFPGKWTLKPSWLEFMTTIIPNDYASTLLVGNSFVPMVAKLGGRRRRHPIHPIDSFLSKLSST